MSEDGQLPRSDYADMPDLEAIGREHARNYLKLEELERKVAELKRDITAVYERRRRREIEEIGVHEDARV